MKENNNIQNNNILRWSVNFWRSYAVAQRACYRGLRYSTAIALVIGIQLGGAQFLVNTNNAWGLEIVASFRPIHSLVAGVVGDTHDVALLMEGDASPHDFTLTPSKMSALENADIIFRVSPRLETSLNRFAKRARYYKNNTTSPDNQNDTGTPMMINLVDRNQYTQPMCSNRKRGKDMDRHSSNNGHHERDGHKNRGKKDRHSMRDNHEEHSEEGHSESDDHGHSHKSKHEESHGNSRDKDDDHGHSHGGHSRGNMRGSCQRGEAMESHAWLDPINAIVMVQKIATILANVDAENAETYTNNAAAMAQNIAKTNQELSSQLVNLRAVPFMATHDAYGSFAQRYDLTYRGGIDDHELTAGKPRQRRQVLNLVNNGKVHCILKENQFNPPVLDILSSNENLNIVTIDTIGAEQETGKDLYVNMMKAVGNQVERCLS